MTSLVAETALHSRGPMRPRFGGNSSPSIVRGRRECRMHAAPEVSCALGRRSTHMSIQGSGGDPTSPAQWLYGLSRTLPGERLFCLRRRRNCFHQLDASTATSGPHVFAVRFRTVRRRHIGGHRDPPHDRDDHDTPLLPGRDGLRCSGDLGFWKTELFSIGADFSLDTGSEKQK